MRMSGLSDVNPPTAGSSVWDSIGQFFTKIAVPIYSARERSSAQKTQMDYAYKMAQLRYQSPNVYGGGGLPNIPGSRLNIPGRYSQNTPSSNYLIPVLFIAGAGIISFLIIKK